MGLRGKAPKPLSREDIERAIKVTKSNLAAARYLNCSFQHYRKFSKLYYDEETGKTLHELHNNKSGKGIPKFMSNRGRDSDLHKILKGEMFSESYSVEKFKTRLIVEAILLEKCCRCGFCEPRVIDYKVPLLLNFKDSNKKNWRQENLELLCYNCYFLTIGDVFDKHQIKGIEDYVNTNVPAPDWELEPYMKEHFKELGLLDKDNDEEEDDDFIAYNKS